MPWMVGRLRRFRHCAAAMLPAMRSALQSHVLTIQIQRPPAVASLPAVVGHAPPRPDAPWRRSPSSVEQCGLRGRPNPRAPCHRRYHARRWTPGPPPSCEMEVPVITDAGCADGATSAFPPAKTASCAAHVHGSMCGDTLLDSTATRRIQRTFGRPTRPFRAEIERDTWDR